MRLSTADDPINEGEIVSWTGLLMDDDSFDKMVKEVRKRAPIRNNPTALCLLGIPALLIILGVIRETVPESAFTWYGIIGFVVFYVLIGLACYFCLCDQTPADKSADNLVRRRRDALQRLCKIPFVVSYRFYRKIETSDGEAYEYYLSLSDENDNDDLRCVLDVADVEFEFGAACPQPSKSKLNVMSKSAKVERISKGGDRRPTIKMRINGWKEI